MSHKKAAKPPELNKRFTFIFLSLFCEKNSDGSRTLRLPGRDLFQRIGNRVKDQDMKQISYFLLNNLDITKLDLCYNDIGDLGISHLVNVYLSNDVNLQYLNLVGCSMGSKAIESLLSVADNLCLRTLRLTGNKLGTEGSMYVSKLMGACETLENVDIGDCDLTIPGLMYVLGALRDDEGAQTLKVLDLSRVIPDSEFYQYPPAHMAESVGLIMQFNTTLVELHMQRCQFDGHDVELLLIGLKYNKTLLLLDLGYNRMDDMGIELIALWIRTRPPLLGLNVAGNHIRNTGARALSFHLPYSKVRLLDLSYNNIGDEGIMDILDSIKKPYMLRLFYIWGNKLGQKSMKIIERMVLSGVLVQEQIDVKIYMVDEVYQHAYYPADRYKHKYYCVMDHGCPIELRIRRNRVDHIYAQPRAKIKLEHYARFPSIDESIPPGESPC